MLKVKTIQNTHQGKITSLNEIKHKKIKKQEKRERVAKSTIKNLSEKDKIDHSAKEKKVDQLNIYK